MQGDHFRDAVIDALRRDLCGPIVDSSGVYPGSTPIRIDRGALIDVDELQGVFWTSDDNEVVRFPPMSRYGIGVLYPRLNQEIEAVLDEQLVEQDEATSDTLTKPVPDSSVSEEFNSVIDAEEEVTPGDSERPSSLALSFLVTGEARLSLHITGALYRPFLVQVGNRDETWWERFPVSSETFTVEISETDSGKSYESRVIDVDGLEMSIGLSIQPPTRKGAACAVTCWARNDSRVDHVEDVSRSCLFQAQLTINLPSGTLAEYSRPLDAIDSSDESLDLLYHDFSAQAVGHGCDAEVDGDPGSDMSQIKSRSLPIVKIPATNVDVYNSEGRRIQVEMDGLSRWQETQRLEVDTLVSGYKNWISGLEATLEDLPVRLRATGHRHIKQCRDFLKEVTEGWTLVGDDPIVHECFLWTCQAMAWQQQAYRASERRIDRKVGGEIHVEGTAPQSQRNVPCWRPFQIAFILAQISRVVSSDAEDRSKADVIWMPTGGGKTEAYLGLAAFTMFYRRKANVREARGTSVIMRYTLRLLTAQQFQRAASLSCAMEIIRDRNSAELGSDRFTVGAWLGRAATPNSRRDAEMLLKNFVSRGGPRPFLLTQCPWCACDLTTQDKGLFGYRIQPLGNGRGTRVQSKCPNPDCDFSGPSGLPVYEIDEDIYEKPPTFLIGTVDKFAMLAWQERARKIFGINEMGRREYAPPDLIIQDELHLITGPLGSLVGLYEGAIQYLCEFDGGRRPRVIAATATTKNYRDQVVQLFDATEVSLVPPPGLSISDNYFSRHDGSIPPRSYVGVCGPGLGRFTRVQARVVASLAHSVGALSRKDSNSANYYWTNVVYFGSLRDLGLSKSLFSTDLSGFQFSLARATGVHSGSERADGTFAATRHLSDVELTSASSSSASDALKSLSRSSALDGSIDLALATSVIEVGIDVSRLGLMTVLHQPKSASSYIQVTGRVGREANAGPGLIVLLFDWHRSRDLSHFERFGEHHRRLFASVEPCSVTPYTSASVERGLRGSVAAAVRQVRPSNDRSASITDEDLEMARLVKSSMSARAGRIGNEESIAMEWSIAEGELSASINAGLEWGKAGQVTDNQFLRRPEVTAPSDRSSWAVPTSLRTVEDSGGLRVDPSYYPSVREAARRTPDSTPSTEGSSEGRGVEW